MDSLQISPEDEEKELIEYEKQLRETYERDMEAFVVQVYEEIEENKKRDIQAITDEAEILADAHRMGLYARAMDAHNDRLQQLYASMEEYYAPKFAEAKKISYCSAPGCKGERKTRCCFFAYYCSINCQKSHWSTHFKLCNHAEFYATTLNPPEKTDDPEIQAVNDDDASEGREIIDSDDSVDAQENPDEK